MAQTLRVKEFPHDIQELEHLIEDLETSQIRFEKEGKYTAAEGAKLDVSEGKRKLENRRLDEMARRQNDQRKQLEAAHNEELREFNAFWNGKQMDQTSDGKKALDQLKQQHDEETRKTLKFLQDTLPSRVKQSVELLNLKTMEQHMSKQKRYMDAHQVQARIAELLKSETHEWDRQRNIKIDTKVSQLQDRHELETIALQKKIATSLDELNVNRRKELERLELKYINIKEDQRAAQEKEQLAFRGEFKSKTSISTSSSKSRN